MMNNKILRIYMKRLTLFFFICCLCGSLYAQGLRHSVCVVYPEYTNAEKEQLADYSLYAARIGMRAMSRSIVAYKSDHLFGSGVLIDYNGKKLILTNRHVIGYAQTANIVFQLNKQNIRYEHCPIIGHSTDNDLAVIELPSSCEQIPLPFYSTQVEEGADIAAAGFPGLGDKASWQLTKGTVSNAQLDMHDLNGFGNAIQHTASIDPGSSGGPLLIKVDGKYHIVGINTWKASYRDGVGIAIPAEDIQQFIASLNHPIKIDQQLLENLRDVNGEQWTYILKHLPDTAQKSIHEMDWNMPLEPIERTLAMADNLTKDRAHRKSAKSIEKKYDASKPHIEQDLDSKANFRVIYDNFFGMNQRAGLAFEYDWLGFIVTGLELSVPMWKCDVIDPMDEVTNKLCAGISGGPFLGAQIPINVRDYILIPRVTQNASVGTIVLDKSDMKMSIAGDTRVGMAVQFPGVACNFMLGVYYDFNILWTDALLEIAPNKTSSSGKNTYFQHGIGITLGVAF